MSVESEILRIQHNLADAYAAVSDKGGKVPLQPNSANFAAAIASIPDPEKTIYSTEERIVGTWIDDSPIYEKTFAGVIPQDSAVNEWIFFSRFRISSSLSMLLRLLCMGTATI